MKQTPLLLALAAVLGLHCGSISPNDCEPDKHFCYDNQIRLCNSRGDASVLEADCSLNKVYNSCEYEGKGYGCLSKIPICQATVKGIFEASIKSKKPYSGDAPYGCQGTLGGAYFYFSQKEAFHFEVISHGPIIGPVINVDVDLSQIVIGKDYPLNGKDLPFLVSATKTDAKEWSSYRNSYFDEEPSGYFNLTSVGDEIGEKWSFEFSGQLYLVATAEKKIEIEVKASGILTPDFETAMYDF